jgi:hypothetical protein
MTNRSSVEDGRRFRPLAFVRALTSGWLNDRIGAKTGNWASVGDRPQSLQPGRTNFSIPGIRSDPPLPPVADSERLMPGLRTPKLLARYLSLDGASLLFGEASRIAPARGSPLRVDHEAPSTDGAKSAPCWDLAAKLAPVCGIEYAWQGHGFSG